MSKEHTWEWPRACSAQWPCLQPAAIIHPDLSLPTDPARGRRTRGCDHSAVSRRAATNTINGTEIRTWCKWLTTGQYYVSDSFHFISFSIPILHWSWFLLLYSSYLSKHLHWRAPLSFPCLVGGTIKTLIRSLIDWCNHHPDQNTRK